MRPRIPALLLLVALAIASRAQDDSWLLYGHGGVARYDVTVDPAALQWMYDNVESDSMHHATLRIRTSMLDEVVEDVGFRLRGNTSRNARKKSFKISFNDFVPGREVHGVDKLNLNGEHNDPSVTRSKLCFDLYGRLGHTASRASHGELWINDQYFGLYVSVEHVDDEFLKKNFEHPDGNLWKCLWPADLAWRGDSPEDYKHESDGRRVYELTSNEEQDDYSALFRLIRILNQTSGNALEDSLHTYLDVAGVLEYFAVNVLVGGWDDYWYLNNNYYLYHDPVDDRMSLIPYDYDNTFGVDWFGIDWSQRNPYGFGSGGRPLAERLLSRPRWRNLFTHMLQHHVEHSLQPAAWQPELDSLRLRLAPHVEADSFYTLDYGFDLDEFHDCFGADYDNAHVKRGLREFLDRRAASLPGQLSWQSAGPMVFHLDVPDPAAEDSLRVTAAAFVHDATLECWLRWRLEGAAEWNQVPMAYTGEPDAPVLRIADRWQGALPPMAAGTVVELQVLALDELTRTHLYPPRPVRRAWPAAPLLALNELLALNASTIQDPAGDWDDWVELVNAGDAPVLLDGLHLADAADDLTNWRFPDGSGELAPGAFLLVWCDNEEGEGPLHAGFRLSGGGESVILTDRDEVTILDQVDFGPQEDDVAWGRRPDGSGPWQALPPTPGSANDESGVEPLLPRSPELTLAAAPNPFNGGLVLTLDGLVGPARLEVRNLAGQRVLARELPAGPSRRTLRLEAAEWSGVASGVYLVEARQESGAVAVLRVALLK
jgi:spore coat protein H